jgi:hypothetical protein
VEQFFCYDVCIMRIGVKERKEVLYFSFLLLLLINFLHISAINNYLYWVYWWFDIMMHFLGGLWVGVTFLWAYILVFRGDGSNQKKFFWMSFGVILLTIISWEVFELFIQNNISDRNFFADTSSDMLLGMVGGAVAYRYFIFNFLKS